jgi:uncharacterized membrane protein YqjE
VNVGVQVLVRLLAQQAVSYLTLGAAAIAEYRRTWIRRIVLLLVGTIMALAGTTALWVSGLVAVWDTQWRAEYVAGSALVLLAVAVLVIRSAVGARDPGPSGSALRGEFAKDRELFEQWKSTL